MMLIKDEIKDKLGNKIVDWYQHNDRRAYILINPGDIKEVARILFKELKLRLATCTGQDTPDALEILYHFTSDETGEFFSIRVRLKDKKKPQIDSITPMFPASEWIEREMWEMLGINFIGHPNLKRLLLAEEWPEGKYPLRHTNES